MREDLKKPLRIENVTFIVVRKCQLCQGQGDIVRKVCRVDKRGQYEEKKEKR